MNCPYCGRPMKEGHITGQNILRIVPDNGQQKPVRRSSDDFREEEYRASSLPGYPLDIDYVGMAPWISAVYCTNCKKAYAQLDMMMVEEGAK